MLLSTKNDNPNIRIRTMIIVNFTTSIIIVNHIFDKNPNYLMRRNYSIINRFFVFTGIIRLIIQNLKNN